MQTTLPSRKVRNALFSPALLLLLLGLVSQVHGAGRALFFISDPVNTKTNLAPATARLATNSFEAKVLVVNRADQTFTIEHQGKLHLFRVRDGTAVYNAKGKKTTLDWVTAGQTVSLRVIEQPSGRLDLLTANVVPNRAQFQAAGTKWNKKTTELTPAPEPTVFPSEDARPHVLEETPVPAEEPVQPAPIETPETPKHEAPTEEPAPEPENAPKSL